LTAADSRNTVNAVLIGLALAYLRIGIAAPIEAVKLFQADPIDEASAEVREEM